MVQGVFATQAGASRPRFQSLKLIPHFAGSDFSRCGNRRIQLPEAALQWSEKPFELFATAVKILFQGGGDSSLCKRGSEFLFGQQNVPEPQAVLPHPVVQPGFKQGGGKARPNRRTAP